jgi:uncharacterized protein
MSRFSVVAAVAVALVVLTGAFFYVSNTKDESRSITIDNARVRVEVVDTESERAQGLSGREALAEGEGMLFVFDDEGVHSFWMKDMKFSIDIIWISREGRVIHIEKNAPPSSYPSVFTPPAGSKYVLVVPAGFVQSHGIEVGSTAAL